MSGVRRAEKAGSWYTSNPQRLARELDGYLATAPDRHGGRVVAVIVPHAGLAFSGPTAARSYKQIISGNPEVEAILLFGAVHTMFLQCPAIWCDGEWETPLGNVEVDYRLARRLVEAGVGEDNRDPHYGDNALELQLPFIRHCFPNAKIVPIATPPNAFSHEAGVSAYDVVSRAGVECIAIGSTDLTHYGRSFGITPAGFGETALAWSNDNDRKLLDLIEDMEAEKIVKTAQECRNACGAGAVAATVAYARSAGVIRGNTLEHTTSYDVNPEGEACHFVGYGAVVFYENE